MLEDGESVRREDSAREIGSLPHTVLGSLQHRGCRSSSTRVEVEHHSTVQLLRCLLRIYNSTGIQNGANIKCEATKDYDCPNRKLRPRDSPSSPALCKRTSHFSPQDSFGVICVQDKLFRIFIAREAVELWLMDRPSSRLVGVIQGFDEYMNIVLGDAEECHVNPNPTSEADVFDRRKKLGTILLKGDNLALITVSPKVEASAPSSQHPPPIKEAS